MTEKKQEPQKTTDGMSRRGFLGAATAATAGLILTPGGSSRAWAKASPGYVQQGMPNSKFAGVQIGTITYSFRSMRPQTPEAVLGYVIASGISSVELMGDPIMQYLGAPTAQGVPNQNQINQMTDPAQRQAAQRQRDAVNAELNRFYASPDMNKVAALKKLFNDNGVTIHLTKMNMGTPEAAEFAFRVSKALGARGNTAEIGDEAVRVAAPVAARHGLVAGFHQHLQPGEANWPGFDHYLAMSPAAALNLDIGHYYASTGKSPVPEIKRLHQRIVSFHLKDRAGPEEGQANMPWGQGGTPIADVLRLLYREKYPINADIELEYPIPEDSNAIIEVRKCVEFCREVLTRVSTPVAPQQRPGGMPGGQGGGQGAPSTNAPSAAPRPQ